MRLQNKFPPAKIYIQNGICGHRSGLLYPKEESLKRTECVPIWNDLWTAHQSACRGSREQNKGSTFFSQVLKITHNHKSSPN